MNAAPVSPAASRVRFGRVLDWRVGGVLLGVLVAAAVGLRGPLGVSSAYVTTEAAVAAQLAPQAAAAVPYWSSSALTPEWVTVVGLFAGAAAAAFLWRTRRSTSIPELWRQRFGGRPLKRFAAAFAGGFLLLLGARIAGGCTSGHVISGMAQLALSGMAFAAAVFASGIPSALLLFPRGKS